MDSLVEIEGSAGNLRGILFELVAAYLARRDAVSIDMGVLARDPETGKSAQIDIIKVTNQSASCVCIECKGKQPGGVVTVAEVEDWFKRLPVFRAHLRNHPYFREAIVSFELWTSGSFHPDALALLQYEKQKRTSAPIDWKDGHQVLAVAKDAKEKAIKDALYEHFLRHPLS